MKAIWHDLECGPYTEDLRLWRSLAAEAGDAVLDVGAGTGRVTLDLARRGHSVTALDRDDELLSVLADRAAGLDVTPVVADARAFELERRFPLCIVPMQTIQLLSGPAGRLEFLCCARRHLQPDGLLAIAISEMLEEYEVIDAATGPYPDICELEGVVYSSQPTAVKADGKGFVLERRRETITSAGERSIEHNSIRLDRLTAEQLADEARAAGFEPTGLVPIPESNDYAGSTVVKLSA